ncbi:hypothetical protein XBFM1_1720037 [Xenorhabdus bovienii str. feltiae Moldova]|uniref:Uncharacterized protein n=1 Tax=Xenorhabdus bovienii str. feltiae Moldova TaxID=1398200 RepID=A0A077NPX9_XENBV|nr:hypothetical protein XBFM1_1720037 [Xenorhabdus bovienii str. feltiae Moldova]
MRYAFSNLLDFLNRNRRSDKNVNFEAFLLILESPYILYNTYLSSFQVQAVYKHGLFALKYYFLPTGGISDFDLISPLTGGMVEEDVLLC